MTAAAGSILRRPADLGFAVFFSFSAAYGLFISLPESLGVPVAPDSPWVPLRWLFDWAVAEEPAHLDPPISLISSTALDGFVHAPFLCVLIYALIRRKAWIRVPALIFAGSSITNMFYYFVQTFLGPHPPPNVAYYLAFNLPWLIAPMLLAVRMRGDDPFGSTRAGPAPGTR
jgi:hypothetical protein